MSSTNHTLGRIDASRCSVCRHPDREELDKALVLKRMTQSDVARRVGVDRSTVSRHIKNHLMPTLASGVLMETKDVAIGSIAEAFDHNYAQSQVLYERAVESGDLRLAATLLDHQRRVLEIIVRYASKMGQATLEDVIAKDPAAERAHYQEVKRNLIEKLNEISQRNERGIVRPDETADAEADPSDVPGQTPIGSLGPRASTHDS